MGIGASQLAKRSNDEAALLAQLGRAAGAQPLPPNSEDGFSATLHGALCVPDLFFPPPPPHRLRDKIAPLCSHLVANNSKTQNFRKVVQHCVWLLEHFPHNESIEAEGVLEHMHETANALTLLRVFTVVIVEARSHPAKHLDTPTTVSVKPTIVTSASPEPGQATSPRPASLFASLVRALGAFLSSRDSSTAEATVAVELGVHAEASRVLIALLASQMCERAPGAPGEPEHDLGSAAVAEVLSESGLAGPLVLSLIRSFTCLQSNGEQTGDQSAQQQQPVSLLTALIKLPVSFYSYLSAVLFYGYTAPLTGAPASNSSGTDPRQTQLAKTLDQFRLAALHLLLVLVHPSASPLGELGTNPFRIALNSLRDDHFVSASSGVPGIDFTRLYDAMTREGEMTDSVVLLLYFLLQGNEQFLRYVLARTDCETLMLPLLQVLYDSVDSVEEWGSQQSIYMLVILLLMLSRDATFSRNLNFVRVRGVWWYREHYLNETTLGGLLVLVVVRVVQTNLRRLRDPYLHSNCLAVLSNSASHFADLPSFAALRLVKVLEMILNKCNGLRRQQQKQQPADCDTTYVGFLQSVLKIIGTALAFGLDRNPHLVYALLQQSEVILPLKQQPEFAEQVAPAQQVIEWFEKEIAAAHPEGQPTVEIIAELIRRRSGACKTALKLRAEQTEYNYEEEPGSHEFFAPYVWSLVFRAPGLHCLNASSVSLFPAQQQQEPTTAAPAAPAEPAAPVVDPRKPPDSQV